MNNEKLYDGITGIREDIVERADAHQFKKKSRNGYDMVTRLSSNLSFMAQTASISNTEVSPAAPFQLYISVTPLFSRPPSP